MQAIKKARRRTHLIQREGAERYLFLTLLSFAASVSLTRLYLAALNYPRIESGELHIAHVLWGGLLLYAAALLPLLFANRRVYTIGALLAGAGMGLFIDEVGKFITTKNDYFFAPAASIIYVLFLLTIVLFLQVQRVARTRARDALARVFEDIWEAMNQNLTPAQFKRLKARLSEAASGAPSEKHAGLANALINFLEGDAGGGELAGVEDDRPPSKLQGTVERALSPKYLRPALVIGLVVIGLLTLKNPATVLLGPSLPGVAAFLDQLRLGRQVAASAAPTWFTMRTGLEIGVGVFMLIAAALLVTKKRVKLGTAVGSLTLLTSLTTISVLLFYFEQFSTIITTSVQFLLLIGMAEYRRKLG